MTYLVLEKEPVAEVYIHSKRWRALIMTLAKKELSKLFLVEKRLWFAFVEANSLCNKVVYIPKVAVVLLRQLSGSTKLRQVRATGGKRPTQERKAG